ncbi:MAG: F0F1 ATP synthase subunit alpha [Clostridia bacterium]|nr:F0F1 ATP synthase subunit alpha [Clostridia bacterium]
MEEFNLQKISEFLRDKIASYQTDAIHYKFGKVIRTGDGVVRITDLPERLYGELLEFGNGSYGMALDLEENGVGAVLFDSSDSVSVGDTAKGTGTVAQIPVGEELLGRIIDPIGRPLDGKPLLTKEHLPVERSAPGIMDRRPIDTPLETGILAIDSMVPIGRGQRELIIGDRQTGKTTIALDTIFNQKENGVICIYCAIGQKASNIAKTVDLLTSNGAMEYSCVVATTASDSPAMQYLTPYAACSIAESFMGEGKDVLIVYDDLSKHAVAYRTMSLLLHRPPGREAYPGDIFYLHSRLLERSACLKKELGGGSITALPIIETNAGNFSAYIPTNVISITDGQIYLETNLFYNGIRPAINTGLSVSRVGGHAQHKIIKKLSGTLRIQLSQYREMAVFTRFGSEVDSSTKKLLKRGECLTMLLKQNKGNPYSLFDEACILLAYFENLFDDIEPDKINAFVSSLIEHLHNNFATLMKNTNLNKDLSETDQKRIIDAMIEFAKVN